MRTITWNTPFVFALWCGLIPTLSYLSNTVNASSVRIVVQTRSVQDVPETQLQAFGQILRRALRTQAGLDVPTQEQLDHALYFPPFDDVAQQRAAANMTRMQSLLERAKKLYLMEAIAIQQRSRYSLKALDLANQLEPSVHVIFNQSKLILMRNQVLQDLYYYYALAYLGLGQEDKAREFTHKLIRLAPFFAPEQHKASNDYLQLFRNIKEELQKHRYTIHLESNPIGATVHYNNLYVGTTPLTLPNLMAGKHKIRLSKMKYLVWQRVANLDPKRLGTRRSIPVKIALKLDPKRPTVDGLPLYQKGAKHNDDILDRMDQIVTKTKADYLYILEPQTITKDKQTQYQLHVAIYRKGYRTLYYQIIPLGSSLDAPESTLRNYSKTIQQQVTSNYFKPPKPIKE